MFKINQTVINNLANKINSKETKNNKTTSLSASSTDTQYPSAKAVYDAISEVGGGGSYINDYYFDSTTNEIILDYSNDGSGGGGGGSSVDIVTAWETPTSDSKVPSEKLTKDTLDAKANSNHSHNLFDLNLQTSTGDDAIIESVDNNSQGVAYANYKLIYNSSDDIVYYDKSGGYDTDNGNELATMNDVPTIADNLTTNDATQVLSAKQGKVLNDLIGQAISYINQ